MCGGGTTSTQTVQIPPEVLENYREVFARGKQAASQPFVPYSADPSAFVAEMTPTQQAAIENINASVGMAQPSLYAGQQAIASGMGQANPLVYGSLGTGEAGLGAATGLYRGAIPMIGQAYGMGQQYAGAAMPMLYAGAGPVNAGPLTQAEIAQYQSPYTEAVAQSTMRNLRQQQEEERQREIGNAIRSGAFGGDRAAIARANLMRQQEMATGQTLSNIYQQGYGQALSTAQQQQAQALAAAQANRAAQAQAAQQMAALGQQQYAQGLGAAQAYGGFGQNLYGLAQQQAALQQQAAQNLYQMGLGGGQAYAGLGSQAEQQALAGAQAQMAAGQQQQQTEQAAKTAMYNQFMQQQGFPYQQTQFLGNLAMGTGALSGSTTTTQSSGSGFFSDRRLKEDAEKIGTTKDGIPIYRFKYKGDDRTQIGLMADEVEKKHPEAVGLSGGYKTVDYEKATEDSAKRMARYTGGLIPSRMGGAVNEPGDYEYGGLVPRAGYAAGGIPDNTGWQYREEYNDWTHPDREASMSNEDFQNIVAPGLREKAVADFYQRELGRAPKNESETDYWENLLAQGTSFDDVQKGIAGSEEGKNYDIKQGVTPGISMGTGALSNNTATTQAADAAKTTNASTTTTAAKTTDAAKTTAAADGKAAGAPAIPPVQKPLTYDPGAFVQTGMPVRNRYGSYSASLGSGASSFSPQAVINNLYQQNLGRNADPSGMNYWRNAYAGGVSPAAIAAAMRASPEYAAGNIQPFSYQPAMSMSPFGMGTGGIGGFGGYGGYGGFGGFGGYGGYGSPAMASFAYANPYGMFGGLGGYGGFSPMGGYGGYQPLGGYGNLGGYGGYGGGLMPTQQSQNQNQPQASSQSQQSQPASAPTSAPSQFNRGGRAAYAKGSIVDSYTMSDIQASQANPYAPYMQNMMGQMPPGAQTYIPAKFLPVPRSILKSDFRPEKPISPYQTAQQWAQLGEMADRLSSEKGLPRRALSAISEKVKGPGENTSPTPSPGAPPAADMPAKGAKPAEYVRPLEDDQKYSIPGYDYQHGGLVPHKSLGGGLPYGSVSGNQGYIPDSALEEPQIRKLPTNDAELRAAAKSAAQPSGLTQLTQGLGAADKLGKLGSKGLDKLSTLLGPGGEAAAATGMGTAASEAAAAGLGAGAAEAAGLGAGAAAAGEAAAGLGTLGSIGTAAAEGISALLAFLPFISDKRAKENVQPIGKTNDGQTIYRFNYKGDPRTQIGLMAQEVEKEHPEAVGRSGKYKTVDYKLATEDAAREERYSGGLVPQRSGYQAGGMSDEDYAIRTIAAEMGGKDPEEARGIAAVIENRLKSGRWGENYRDVVTARSQFEPWSNPDAPNYPMRFAADSPRMQMAREAFAARSEDPTGGALNFYAPAAQAILAQTKGDRAAIPSWARDREYTDIGPTRFVRGVDAPRPAGLVPAGEDRVAAGTEVIKPAGGLKPKEGFSAPKDPRGQEQTWGDFLTSRQFIIPALTALGTMGTTPTRNFGTALSAGVLAGAKSFQDLEEKLSDVEKKREEVGTQVQQTGKVGMETRVLESGLYERQWVRGRGWYILDKSNPTKPPVQITDKDLKPLPGFEGKVEKVPVKPGSELPTGGKAEAPKPSEGRQEAPKPAAAPAGQKLNVNTWNPTVTLPDDYEPPEHLNIEMDPKMKEQQAAIAKPIVEEQARKAEAAYDQIYALDEMDKQFSNLPKEGFLVPGAYAEERKNFANRANTFIQGMGGKAAFNPDDVAALESISKNTFRLGSALARSIGSREPGFIVQQSVQANPGIENTPMGYMRISAGLREAAKYEQDKAQFYNNYYSRFGHLSGAEEMFRQMNPPQMYADRAILSTVDPRDREALVNAVRDNPEILSNARSKIDGKYGKVITDKILGR